MIVSLFYYPHGICAAQGDDGHQDPRESEPWYLRYCAWLTSLGRADQRTIVCVPTVPLVALAHLRPPDGCSWPEVAADPLARVSFHPKGETACVRLDGVREPALERHWWRPSIEDKLARGVCTPACKLTIPNVYRGSIGHYLAQVQEAPILTEAPGA